MTETRLDPYRAVETGAIVEARTGPGAIHGCGRVVSYSIAPVYTIERSDGSRFTWRADMTHPASSERAIVFDADLKEREAHERMSTLPANPPQGDVVTVRGIHAVREGQEGQGASRHSPSGLGLPAPPRLSGGVASMSTDRVPVFIRVGTIPENLVGSVPIEPVPDNPDKVRIAGGAIGLADLLDAVSTEIRCRHGQPAVDHRTLLIAGSEHDAKRWQRRYPGRWSDVCTAAEGTAAALEGFRITLADVTPAALASEHLDAVVDVVERSIAGTAPRGARVGVGYLEPQ